MFTDRRASRMQTVITSEVEGNMLFWLVVYVAVGSESMRRCNFSC